VGPVTIFDCKSHHNDKHRKHLAGANDAFLHDVLVHVTGYKHGHGVPELAVCGHVQAAVMVVCSACSGV
jgi:hypothetical protein